MPTKRREATTRVAVLTDCRHYWIIEPSQQIESRGRCRLCGEERTFQNKLSSANKKPEMVVEAIPFEDAPPSPPSDGQVV
jgi:hypothetical protein